MKSSSRNPYKTDSHVQTNSTSPPHFSYLKYVCDTHLVTHDHTNNELQEVIEVGCYTEAMILRTALSQESSFGNQSGDYRNR